MGRVNFKGGMSKTYLVVSVLSRDALLEIRLEMRMRPRKVCFGKASDVDIKVVKRGEIVLVILAA